MWIIEWSNLNDYEFSVTGWASEDEALKAACTQIIAHLEHLDVSDSDDLFTIAEVVNELIADKRYGKAVQRWNDSTYNNDSLNPLIWTVRKLTPQHFIGVVPTLDKKIFGYEDEGSTQPGGVVNDHTCILCGNAKCSKQESSCWKCGNPIS